MLRPNAIAAFAICALACASSPPAARIQAPVLTPGANEQVAVDQLIVLVDSSSSVDESTLFRDEKALVESFARSMPEGDYEAGSIAFGGFDRTRAPLEDFERKRVQGEAAEITHLAEGTPIHKALDEASIQLGGKKGRAAVVLYSDGLITDEVGRELDPQLAIDAANNLNESYDGTVCLHTVQTGSDPDGAALLRQISETTECGTFRTLGGVRDVASLQQFERDVFLEQRLPDVAAAPADLDGDGVLDANDLCPGTPRGAGVDTRGCWIVKGLLFDTDSATIDAAGREALDDVAAVLRQNPSLRVELGGHTDSQGTEAYNRGLSDRRAEAARSYLVAEGIAASRLEAKGFGESNPAADNATAEGRHFNRRTQVEVLD
jgi:OOP family OmpA-OmpF porin